MCASPALEAEISNPGPFYATGVFVLRSALSGEVSWSYLCTTGKKHVPTNQTQILSVIELGADDCNISLCAAAVEGHVASSNST